MSLSRGPEYPATPLCAIGKKASKVNKEVNRSFGNEICTTAKDLVRFWLRLRKDYARHGLEYRLLFYIYGIQRASSLGSAFDCLRCEMPKSSEVRARKVVAKCRLQVLLRLGRRWGPNSISPARYTEPICTGCIAKANTALMTFNPVGKKEQEKGSFLCVKTNQGCYARSCTL